tara:strand:- start:636 stop:1178 length:543 start_codon:yes stop_codon:yes gene_type:complete
MKSKKKLIATPSQTVGPFYSNFLKFNFKKTPLNDIYYNKNYSISINCKIRDKNGSSVKDGFIEYYQTDNINNKYNLLDLNRVKFNVKSKCYLINLHQYSFTTYINIIIFARGLLNHLNTIVLLEDDPNLNKNILYNSVSLKRRDSLIAKFVHINNNIKYYQFDLYLSGSKETIFFNALPN